VEIFLLGAALAFSINIELGVVNVMLVRTAIDRGAWPAFLIGLGSCIGDVIWACAGALGVSALLQWQHYPLLVRRGSAPRCGARRLDR